MVVQRSIEIKEKVRNAMLWFKKRYDNSEEYIAPMNFAEYIKKSNVSKNSKVYYGPFIWNGLHERYCGVSISRWDV